MFWAFISVSATYLASLMALPWLKVSAFSKRNSERVEWFQRFSNHEPMVIIQTLRNWIMSASFLASTAVLVSLGLWQLDLQNVPMLFTALASASSLLAFMSLSVCLRSLNQLSFYNGLMSAPVQSLVRQISFSYFLGLRLLLLSPTLWIAGIHLILAFGLLTLQLLFFLFIELRRQ